MPLNSHSFIVVFHFFSDYITIARLLLDAGADVNKPLISSGGNSTALIEASQLGDVQMCDLLLRYKAVDPHHKVGHAKAAEESLPI